MNRVVEQNALQPSNGKAVQKNGGLAAVDVVLIGVTPLLVNAMSQDQLLAIRSKEKGSRNMAKPSLREEAEGRLHVRDGRPHVPSRCLYGCFVNAGQFVRLDGKRQISSQKATVLPGMLSLLSTEIWINAPGSEESAAWEVDIQQGRNPNGGEAVCIVRPRFDEWELSISIEVDQAQMPLSQARDLLDIAGKRIGLLDFRPQKRGTYGRFVVKSWQVVKN